MNLLHTWKIRIFMLWVMRKISVSIFIGLKLIETFEDFLTLYMWFLFCSSGLFREWLDVSFHCVVQHFIYFQHLVFALNLWELLEYSVHYLSFIIFAVVSDDFTYTAFFKSHKMLYRTPRQFLILINSFDFSLLFMFEWIFIIIFFFINFNQ